MVIGVTIDNPVVTEDQEDSNYRMGRKELIALISSIMGFTAVGIDFMLAAFAEMRVDFGLGVGSTETSRIITVYFLGLAAGQLFYGPIADRFGRKPALLTGAVVYILGAVIAALATTFSALLIGRFVWGLGAAGARVVAVAVIRDRFEGEAMASALSNVMAVFLIVPVVAPSIGAAIITVLPWRSLFWMSAVFACLVVLWSLRLRETLDPANRRELSPRLIGSGYLQVARTPVTFGYTMSAVFIQAAFTVYVSSLELLVTNVFDRESQFPVIFGAVAMMFVFASVINGQVVERLTIDTVVNRAFATALAVAVLMVVVAVLASGKPNFWLFMPLLGVVMGSFMFLMPNLSSAAMLPLGDIAGSGSALTGAFRVGTGAIMGGVIAEQISTSTTPLAIGLAGLLVCSAITVWLVRQGGIRALITPMPM